MTLRSFYAGSRVVVTGGAGFIGAHLTRQLVGLGAKVRVVDNLERGSREAIADVLDRVDLVVADLRDSDECMTAIGECDVVVHLASKVGGIRYYLSKPYQVLHDNMLMDANTLNALIASKVPYYFYASSAHIYPVELQMTADAADIVENQALPAHPQLSYGWAKLMGEKRIEYAIAEGLPVRASVARIIGAYGPGQDFDLAKGSAIPVFIRRAIEYPKSARFTVLGTGDETRSYCYIDDIVEGILRSIYKAQNVDLVGPFNLGRNGRNTIREIAETVIEISGKKISISWDTSVETAIWGQALDCSYATKLLDGWEAKIALRDGLSRCYRDIEQRMAGKVA
jgi:nucleoside-diphosphate-sugar epimerase